MVHNINFTIHVYDYTKHVTCILCWRILSLNWISVMDPWFSPPLLTCTRPHFRSFFLLAPTIRKRDCLQSNFMWMIGCNLINHKPSNCYLQFLFYAMVIYFIIIIFLDLHPVQIPVRFTWNTMLLNFKIMNLKLPSKTSHHQLNISII